MKNGAEHDQQIKNGNGFAGIIQSSVFCASATFYWTSSFLCMCTVGWLVLNLICFCKHNPDQTKNRVFHEISYGFIGSSKYREKNTWEEEDVMNKKQKNPSVVDASIQHQRKLTAGYGVKMILINLTTKYTKLRVFLGILLVKIYIIKIISWCLFG